MKILMLQDDFPPDVCGGAEISTLGIACGLQKAGHEVFVITTCRDKSSEGECVYLGVKIIKIYADYHERWRAYLSLYNPQTVGKVRELIKKINPDIVHAHNIHYYLSYACLKSAKKLQKPVFLTVRDVMPFSYGKLATKKYLEKLDYRVFWWDNFKQAQKRYNPLRNVIIRHYFKKYVNKIFAISCAVKNALNQNGIQNVGVIYNGIDVDEWVISPERIEEFRKKYNLQNKKIILFAGRISALKGSAQIDAAMIKIKKEVPSAVLLTAGDGGIGWLRGEELKAAYHASDVVTVPSVCFDSFGRVNIEAMACKKPVVGTCFGGVPEVIQDGVTGYVVNPFKTEFMADKIIDLLKNPEKANKFGEAGYERAKKCFNLADRIAEMVRYYQKFL
ncbi:MAG: glycosyltransferase family 4 protein [Candidatus Nealsonbacteria bacterium]